MASNFSDICIRPARETELDAVLELRDRAREFMRSYGNTTQWPDGTPPRFRFENDLAGGHLYVVVAAEDVDKENPELLGAMSIVPSPDPTYAEIDGAWIGQEPYHSAHRVMVAKAGMGLGRRMLAWAYENFGHLRIDTHADNAPMLGCIAASGFTRCGIVIVEDGTERIAFEKL